jgi:hypothetical protein
MTRRGQQKKLLDFVSQHSHRSPSSPMKLAEHTCDRELIGQNLTFGI